jgi:membrane protein DedA with SNARE-associated domain
MQMGLTEFLAQYLTAMVLWAGYIGIFLLMMAESTVLPVPSEAVLPFAGFLVYSSQLDYAAVMVVATAASLCGSFVSYAAGRWGGKPFVLKFGKYLLLNEEHLLTTERFFSRFGAPTIFLCRFVPVVRHFISIPGGVGKMKLPLFLGLTALGAGMWNAFLTWAGIQLKKNWEVVIRYAKVVDLVIICILLALVVLFVVRQIRAQKAKQS